MVAANIDITDADNTGMKADGIVTKTASAETPESEVPEIEVPESEVPETDKQRFERLYRKSSEAIFHEHSQHEVFYKVLKLVDTQSDEKALLCDIRALPEMKVTLRTPRYYLDALYRSGALVRIPVAQDAQAPAQDPAQDAQTLTQDAQGTQDVQDTQGAQDASRPMGVEHYRWFLSPVGEQLIADLSPLNRLDALLARDEKARPIYESILRYCTTPRMRMEIDAHLAESGICEGIDVFTSFFLDELEQNGGLIWVDAWTTTKEGEMASDRESEPDERESEIKEVEER